MKNVQNMIVKKNNNKIVEMIKFNNKNILYFFFVVSFFLNVNLSFAQTNLFQILDNILLNKNRPVNQAIRNEYLSRSAQLNTNKTGPDRSDATRELQNLLNQLKEILCFDL